MNWLYWTVIVILAIGALVGVFRGALKTLVTLGILLATTLMVYFVNPYVSRVITEITPIDEVIEKNVISSISNETEMAFGEGAEIPRQLQIKIIENSDIPKPLQTLLLDNNNKEVYSVLGAGSFAEYIGKYFAKLIVDILSFGIMYIVVAIVLRAVICSIEVIEDIPVLGFLNRISGIFVGSAVALIAIWFLFIGITMIYTTEIGKQLLQMINENPFLTYLHENNLILKVMTNFH